MNKERLLAGAALLDVSLSVEQVEMFEKYYFFLEDEGRKVNLTRIRGEEVIPGHFLDSLTGLKVFSLRAADILLDVGSGAGFPGIPLKIVHPEVEIHFLDASLKRLDFLERLANSLGLQKIRFYHGRAEDYGHKEGFRSAYNWVVSRALASLPVLLEFCLPFCSPGGFFCAYKGPEGEKELNESSLALDLLGGEIKKIYKCTLPFREEKRCLLLVEKQPGSMPRRYPRRAGVPAKRPIGSEVRSER